MTLLGLVTFDHKLRPLDILQGNIKWSSLKLYSKKLCFTVYFEKVPESRAGDAFLKWQTANKSKVMKRVHATVGILRAALRVCDSSQGGMTVAI